MPTPHHIPDAALLPILAQTPGDEALSGTPLIIVLLVVTFVALAVVYNLLKSKRADTPRKATGPEYEVNPEHKPTETGKLIAAAREGTPSDEFDRVLSEEEVAALPIAKRKRYNLWLKAGEGKRVTAQEQTQKARTAATAAVSADSGKKPKKPKAVEPDDAVAEDVADDAKDDAPAAGLGAAALPPPGDIASKILKPKKQEGEVSEASSESEATADEASDATNEAAETPAAEASDSATDAADDADEAAEASDTSTDEADDVEETPEASDEASAPEADSEPEEEAPAPEPARKPETAKKPEPAQPAAAAASDDGEPRTSMSAGLERSRAGFGSKLRGFFSGGALDEDLLDEIEMFLYEADVGTKATDDIIKALNRLDAEDKANPARVWEFIYNYVLDTLKRREAPIDWDSHKPFVLLVVGVNGAGKTTTIGKLAHQLKRAGKSVMVVAGDTFRAGAVDQLAVWADRNDIPLHQGKHQQDPASVVYEGIERGVAEEMDVIICDTSGRLHTNKNLMAELQKIHRVAGKALDGAPHETVLVLDANTGQNAVQQAKMFSEIMDLSGLVLTKLDGTARGGVILAIGKELDVPVRYIGIGEGIYDLRPFDSEEFVEALFM